MDRDPNSEAFGVTNPSQFFQISLRERNPVVTIPTVR